MNPVAVSTTRFKYIHVRSHQHLAAMDGGDAENAGAIFCLLATVVETTTGSMP